MPNTLKNDLDLVELGEHIVSRHDEFEKMEALFEFDSFSPTLASYHKGRKDELEYFAQKIADILKPEVE